MRFSTGLSVLLAVRALFLPTPIQALQQCPEPTVNLLCNGDAESGGLARWIGVPSRTLFEVVAAAPWGGTGSYLFHASGDVPSPPHGAQQEIDVDPWAFHVDQGGVSVRLRALLGGDSNDQPRVVAYFRNADGTTNGIDPTLLALESISAEDGASETSMLAREAALQLPQGTRTIIVQMLSSQIDPDGEHDRSTIDEVVLALEGIPRVHIDAAEVEEADGPVDLTVTVLPWTLGEIPLRWSAGGPGDDALPGQDYGQPAQAAPVEGDLAFSIAPDDPLSDVVRTIQIPIVDDLEEGPDRSFTVSVWHPADSAGINASATVRIRDDDGCTITWRGNQGGFFSSWGNSANWDLERVPGEADRVCIGRPSDDPIRVSGTVQIESIRGIEGEEMQPIELTPLSILRLLHPLRTSEIGTLVINGGRLDTAGDVQMGNLAWNGGYHSGSGTTTVTGPTTLQRMPQGPLENMERWLEDRVLRLEGGTSCRLSGLTLGAGAVVENAGMFEVSRCAVLAAVGGGAFRNQPGASFGYSAVAPSSLIESDTSWIHVEFQNESVVTTGNEPTYGGTLVFTHPEGLVSGAQSSEALLRGLGGTVSVPGGFTQQGGRTELEGTIDGDVAVHAGQFSATTVRGDVSVLGGTVVAWRTRVDGDYLQAPPAVLRLGVFEEPGLDVTGTATLGGGLALDWPADFEPAGGDLIRVLDAGSRSGAFAKEEDAAPYEIQYHASGVDLALGGVSVVDAVMGERGGKAEFIVELSPRLRQVVGVPYRAVLATPTRFVDAAIPRRDFALLNGDGDPLEGETGILHFRPGSHRRWIPVRVHDDGSPENVEAFAVELGQPFVNERRGTTFSTEEPEKDVPARRVRGRAVGTIVDDDSPSERIALTLKGGGFVFTDYEGDGATEEDPIETNLSLPERYSGIVAVEEFTAASSAGAGFPSGLLPFGGTVRVSLRVRPAVLADDPMRIEFQVHGSAVPAGLTLSDLVLLHDGLPVQACESVPAGASPDSCLVRAFVSADGYIRVRVLATEGGTWTFAAAAGL